MSREDRDVQAVATAIWHVRNGDAQAAMDTLETHDPTPKGAFIAAYILATFIASRIPGEGGTVQVETVMDDDATFAETEAGIALGAIIAAAANRDVNGAWQVFYTDANISGQVLGDLLVIAARGTEDMEAET